MRVYRIASKAHISDLTGTGARLHGGRWNHKGTSVIYTSESRALATTEYLVHVPIAMVPANLHIATIEIQAEASVTSIDVKTLPSNWRQYPAPASLATIGSQWAQGHQSLLLRVPSVVVRGDFNVLISPVHPEFRRIAITAVELYELDKRFFT
jgi:RES domain-containing protein